MPEGGDYDAENPHIGSQSPRTGTRFGGIFTFSRKRTDYVNPTDTLYREYLQAELSQPLIPGKRYCGGMYVSLAEQPRYAANNLAMYFSETQLDLPGRAHIPVTPTVLEKSIITNATDWTGIEGAFEAITPARYVILGNFSDNANTEFIDKGGTHSQAASYKYAYYFIDDVSVVQFPEKMITTSPTTICQGEEIVLNSREDIANVQWFSTPDYTSIVGTGRNLRISPVTTTTYYLKGTFCTSHVVDQVTITVKPFVRPDLGNVTILCEETEMTLDPGQGYQSYLWSDQSTDTSLVINRPGHYSVSVTNEVNCKGFAEIEIAGLAKPVTELGKDQIRCVGAEPIELTTPNRQGETYLWSTGETANTVTVTESGIYWINVANACGETSDTVRVETFDELFIPNIITPNEDGFNSFFTIKGLPVSTHATLTIVNRYGRIIAYIEGYKNSWPDAHAREDLPGGIYYYLIQIWGCNSTFKGWLQVMR